MSKTKIEWTKITWNPVTGCTKYSPGCANCYAEAMTPRQIGERYGDRIADRFRESATFVRFNEASYRKGGAK